MVDIDLPPHPQEIDETGRPWVCLCEARDPTVVAPGAVMVAGDPDEPVLARILDVTSP